MKNAKQFYTGITFLISVVLLLSCKEDFLERPPKDTIVDGSFYQNDDQVLAGTALLYNKVWFDYNDKASYNLGDFRGGTAFSAYNDRGNVEFNTTANTPENGASWRAFFNVVGQSNTAIQNINKYAGAGVSPGVKKYAIAEARFMRSLAYRFLVMNWGAVPIIENNLTLLSDTTIARNTVESVWKYATREMRAAANDLPEVALQTGRLNKWAAEAMLARYYLTRSGIGATAGSRNQVFLDSAKYYAKRVIDLSGAALRPTYDELFKFPYDNNSESLFSLQWFYSGPTTWGTQNSTPAYLAYSSDIANGDGWGGDKSATLWTLQQYDGFIANGKTLDQRLKATFMLPGASYPEITQSITGGEQKLIFPFTGTDNNFTSIKKYVTGKAKDVNGEAASQRYGNDTYMIRLAEVYLIYAEAILGNSSSTVDATAVQYFNKVHMRAGLPAFEDPLTFDVIFKERIVEFAMEGMSWYDLVSLHYYDPAKAYSIISNQDRALFFVEPNQFPNPSSWKVTPTAWVTTRTYTANSGNFLIPVPAAELSQAPNLAKPPVEYNFNK